MGATEARDPISKGSDVAPSGPSRARISIASHRQQHRAAIVGGIGSQKSLLPKSEAIAVADKTAAIFVAERQPANRGTTDENPSVPAPLMSKREATGVRYERGGRSPVYAEYAHHPTARVGVDGRRSVRPSPGHLGHSGVAICCVSLG